MNSKQLKSPCSDCPFSRQCAPGATGGSPASTYIGQAYGPFLLNCHSTPEYAKNKRSFEARQCAGAAIFRSNVGVASRMPKQLHILDCDTQAVFATSEELLAHHSNISIENASSILQRLPPQLLALYELNRTGVAVVDRKCNKHEQ